MIISKGMQPRHHILVAFATPANKSKNWYVGLIGARFELHITIKVTSIRILTGWHRSPTVPIRMNAHGLKHKRSSRCLRSP